MATPDDAGELPARVARLEQEVAQLREHVALSGTDASAARVLASGADRERARAPSSTAAWRTSATSASEEPS